MWPLDSDSSERRVALVVVVTFVVAGSLWIVVTDFLLYSLVDDPMTIARIETAKGWAFVGLAALLIYLVALRSAARLTRATGTVSAVLDSIGDGVLLLGPDRAIAYANPASIKMLAAGSLDELVGMGAPEFSRRFHVSYPDGRLVPPQQFVSQRVFDEAGPIRYKEILHPPGVPAVVISCTAAAVRREIGESPDLVVSVLHDITVTEHLDALRDGLFSAAAHAIKTPVAVIKSNVQLLSGHAMPDVRRSTGMIERQCARIEGLVENLLTLSRIRSGTLQLHPETVDLAALLQEVAGEIARLTRGQELHLDVDDHPRVRADPERLEMVLRNVMHGALRSSRPGDPVGVRLARDGLDAQITVTWQPALPTIEPGAHEATELDDLGVGRYVTSTIVEAHGGTFSEDVTGDETTMRVRLPVMAEAPS